MLYRTLGRTGLRVSVIGIGTWQFGGEWGRAYAQSEVDAILDRAGELGVNLIDTAECYGDHLSERLIGDYLSRRDRSRWIVATKFGHQFHSFMKRTEHFSASAVREQLETSLRALGMEAIDLYQFHSGSDDQCLNEDLWSFIEQQKRAGKVRHAGISILGKGSEVQAREAGRLGAEALQVIYNRLDRRPEETVFPHAQRDNLGVLARVPLASGLLSGKYSQGAAFAADDVRSTWDQQKLRGDIHQAQEILEREVPAGVSKAQWALAWCLRHPQVTAVIPGCKDPSQVEINVSAATLLEMEGA